MAERKRGSRKGSAASGAPAIDFEHGMRGSEELYRAVFDASNDPIFLLSVGPDGMPGLFVQVNDAACRTLGYSRDELVGMSPRDVLDPADVPEIRPTRDGVGAEGRAVFTRTWRAKDGTKVPVEISSRLVEIDGKPMEVAVARDLTEVKRAQGLAAERETFVASVTRAVPDVVFVYDLAKRHITYTNPYASRGLGSNLGFAPAEIEAMGPEFETRLVHPADRADLQRLFERIRCAGDEEVVETELRFSHAAGGWRVLHLRGLVFHRMADGVPDQVVVVMRDVTEARRAEEETRESHDFLNLLLGSLDSTVLVVDQATRLVGECNAVVESMFGYARDELVGHSVRLIHVDDEAFEEFGERLSEAFSSGFFQAEFRFRRKSGEIFDAEVVAKPLGPDRESRQMVGIIHDITERKRAQRAIEESEERFRAIVESTPMGMHLYELADDGRLVFAGANPAADRILGVDHGEFVGKTIEEAFPGLVGTEVPDMYRRIAREGGLWNADQIDYEHARISGAFEVHAFRTAPRMMAASFLDVTDRKRAQAAIQRSEKNLRDAQRIGHLGSWTWNMTTGDVKWSEELFEIMGLDPSRVTPSRATFMECVHKDDAEKVEAILRHALACVGTVPFECRIARPDGQVRHLSNSVETACDSSGHPVNAVGIAVDVTEQKRADQLKDDFVSMVSHELRTPLTAILGYEAMLERMDSAKDPHATSAALAAMRARAWQMVRLVDELLDVSQIQAGKLELNIAEASVRPLVEGAAGEVTCGPRHQLVLDVAADAEKVRCDATRMGHVVRNLVANAMKFSPEGGTVTVRAAVEGGRLRIEVTDEGIGVHERDTERIFERFEQGDMSATRGFGGVGIGLYFARMIVEAHGGTIGVKSELGVGSTFTVDIPA